jgi:hypothetical protein
MHWLEVRDPVLTGRHSPQSRSLQHYVAGSHDRRTQILHTLSSIGFAGPTPTGKEPALIITAPHLPLQTAQPPLVFAHPSGGDSKHKHSDKDKEFNILQSWGQLSPWYSVESHGLKKAESVQPEGCKIVGMHWLQRHGAR